MNFTIIEEIINHNEWDSIKGFLFGIIKIVFVLILLPILLIFLLLKVFSKEKIEVINIEWKEFYTNESLKIERLFIDENELPDNLDYPQEPNDIYLFKLKSEPKILELEVLYFDFQFIKSKQGIFLLSFNTIGKGMTVWFIDNKEQKLERVKDLESSWWNFGKKNGLITLKTTLNKQDITIIIEKRL